MLLRNHCAVYIQPTRQASVSSAGHRRTPRLPGGWRWVLDLGELDETHGGSVWGEDSVRFRLRLFVLRACRSVHDLQTYGHGHRHTHTDKVRTVLVASSPPLAQNRPHSSGRAGVRARVPQPERTVLFSLVYLWSKHENMQKPPIPRRFINSKYFSRSSLGHDRTPKSML